MDDPKLSLDIESEVREWDGKVETDIGASKVFIPQKMVRPSGNQVQKAASILAMQIPAGRGPALCGPLEILWVHISDPD